MKKLLVYFMTVALIMGTATTASFGYSKTAVDLVPGASAATVNSEKVTLDTPAQVVNGRTLVPIRFVAENLGFKVDWNQAKEIVTIGETGEVVLPIGEKSAVVNGKTVALDVPARVEKGRTLVPLRFVAESLGADVSWDQKNKTASIEYSPQLEKAKKVYGEPVEGEKAVLDKLDAKFAYDIATKLTTFGDARDGRGMRLVGSKAGKDAAQYAFDSFKAAGLSPEFDTFPATGWEYYASSLKIKGHENLNYFITSAPYTPATAAEGLKGELVYVGKGTTEELDKVDLKGKIALAEFDWDYISWMNDLEVQVAGRGATGLIYYCTNGYGTDKSGKAEFVGDWSGKAATIPTWSMAQLYGKELAALAQKEKLEVTAISDCKTIENATGYNVLATINGNKYPDEYIVINAHTDAYFKCLQDDSAPVGIVIAMAKAMVDADYKPDRSIIFVTTDGEEAGGGETFYDWLVGSWALVNEKVNEWDGKIVDAHTIEMVGDNTSTNFGYRVSDTMYMFAKAMTDVQNENKVYGKEITVDNFMTTSSDEWSFSYMGNPTTRTIMEDRADEVYHSSMDNPARFSLDNYNNHLKAQTNMVLRIDKQTFAPYDLSKTAEDYQALLKESLLKAQKQNYDGLNTAVDTYLKDSWKLVDLNLEISDLYNKAKVAGKDIKTVEPLIADYNKDMRAVAKTVIQGTQYVALDVVIPQVDFYQYIPSVFDSAITSLKAGKGQEMLDNFDLDSEDQGQYATWFASTYDEKTWQNSYFEALAPDNSDQDYKWVNGRLLKYYDYYGILKSVKTKVTANDKDFSKEIAALTQMRDDVQKRLSEAVTEDTNMWNKAKSQLPISKAEKILAELQK